MRMIRWAKLYLFRNLMFFWLHFRKTVGGTEFSVYNPFVGRHLQDPHPHRESRPVGFVT